MVKFFYSVADDKDFTTNHNTPSKYVNSFWIMLWTYVTILMFDMILTMNATVHVVQYCI